MRLQPVNILSTRPLNDSLAEKAAAANIFLQSDAFISTVPIQDDSLNEEIASLSEQNIIAVFTSANAIKTVAAILKDRQPTWRIFGMGTTTSNLLTSTFRCSDVRGGAENALALAEQIVAEGNIDAIIFFCGDQRRDELPVKLKQHNIQVKELKVYKTISQPHAVDKTYDGVMFFSPSAVESFFRNNSVGSDTIFFAIGQTTARTIEQYSSNKVITSDYPGKEDLVNKVIAHFNTINQHT